MAKEALYRDVAKYYDKIYHWKDYGKEAGFIDQVIKKFNRKAKTILDIPCGTGNHSILLKRKGYSVVGVDISLSMLKLARKKIRGMKFIKDDMKGFDLKEKFDVIICMFSSINYNLNIKEMRRTLRNFNTHLKNGGLLIFDLGFTPFDVNKSRRIDAPYEDPNLKIGRFSQVEKKGNELTIRFIILINKKGKLDFVVDEHTLGYFTVNQVKKLMREIGFKTSIYDDFSLKTYGKKSEKPVFVGIRK